MTDAPHDHHNQSPDVRQLTRRAFVALAASGLSLAGTAAWVASRPHRDGLPWPLRAALDANDRLAASLFPPLHSAPEPARLTAPRINGALGLDSAPTARDRQLLVAGIADVPPMLLPLSLIQALPSATLATTLHCIQGWTMAARWTGARVRDLLAHLLPAHASSGRLPPYVALATANGGYYVSLDTASLLHPQTLLAYAMNDAPLSLPHGAPLRVIIPVKYGVKNLKRVGLIRFSRVRPPDFKEQQGLDWFCGL